MKNMDVFFVSAAVTAMLLMAGIMIARNMKYRALATVGRSFASVVLLSGAALLASDIAAGEGMSARMPLDLSLLILALSSLSDSSLPVSCKKAVASVCIAVTLTVASYYILSFAGIVPVLPAKVSKAAVAGVSAICLAMPMMSIWIKMRSVRSLMQTGSVWHWVQLAADVFTPMSYAVIMFAYLLAGDRPWMCWCTSAMMTAMIFCYCSRIITDSVFALLHRHERRIVESMKLSPIENLSNIPEDDNVFKELYGRIQTLFEEEKPYLNGNLTINDIVSSVFSNKVYISRAISMYSGRNFCQYVNYHRVMYSIEYFRMHPETKMADLWPHCGFNSAVSFNMSFRLFMGENPSDWCRKEKIRLTRRRK